MNIGVFLLLMAICLGLVYLVHKYFGKKVKFKNKKQLPQPVTVIFFDRQQ